LVLTPDHIAKLLGLCGRGGLDVPLIRGIAIAMGLTLEVLEDQTEEWWSSVSAELGHGELVLKFKRRQMAAHRAHE